MKNPPAPSYSAEHTDECCMSCGARIEGGEPGKCNRCGGDFNAGRKQASVQIRNLAKQAAGAEIEKKALWGAAAKLGLKGLGMGAKALGYGARVAPTVAKGAIKAAPVLARNFGTAAKGVASGAAKGIGKAIKGPLPVPAKAVPAAAKAVPAAAKAVPAAAKAVPAAKGLLAAAKADPLMTGATGLVGAGVLTAEEIARNAYQTKQQHVAQQAAKQQQQAAKQQEWELFQLQFEQKNRLLRQQSQQQKAQKKDPTLRKSPDPAALAANPDQYKSLADVLPAGYRRDAQAYAKAYRESQGPDLFEPGVGWAQSLDDKALDRKVRVERLEPTPTSPNGQYIAPTLDSPVDSVSLYEDDPSTLGHELTHATQGYEDSLNPAPGVYRKPTQAHSVLVDGLIRERGGDIHEGRPGTAGNFGYGYQTAGDYLSNPAEEEAYLATLKRDYYQDTGKHVTSQEEARKAIEWVKQQRQRSAYGIEQLLGPGYRGPDTLKRQELWIQELIKRMPGLVSNNQSNHGKQASVQIQNLAKMAAGDALQQLIEAKSESDRKNYAAKHAILRNLLAQYPDDFKVDAATGKYHGLTHNPSGFKIHAPRDIAGMAKAAAAVTELEKQAFAAALAKLGLKGLGMAGKYGAKALGFGARAATKAVPTAAKAIPAAVKAIPAAAKAIPAAAKGAIKAAPVLARNFGTAAKGVASGAAKAAPAAVKGISAATKAAPAAVKGISAATKAAPKAVANKMRASMELAPGDNLVAGTARYASRVPQGEKFFSRNPLKTGKNALNFSFRPKYPVLEKAAPRLAQAARTAAGTTTAATLGVGAYEVGVQQPGQLASAVANRTGELDQPPKQFYDAMESSDLTKAYSEDIDKWQRWRQAAISELPGNPDALYPGEQWGDFIHSGVARPELQQVLDKHWDSNYARFKLPPDELEQRRGAVRDAGLGYLKSKIGLGSKDQSPLTQGVNEATDRLLVPTWRRMLQNSRENYPGLMGASDVVRSLTPAGLAGTLLVNGAKTEKRPPTGQVIEEMVAKYGPQVLDDPQPSAESPYVDAIQKLIPPRVVYENANYKVKQRLKDSVRQQMVKLRDPENMQWVDTGVNKAIGQLPWMERAKAWVAWQSIKGERTNNQVRRGLNATVQHGVNKIAPKVGDSVGAELAAMSQDITAYKKDDPVKYWLLSTALKQGLNQVGMTKANAAHTPAQLAKAAALSSRTKHMLIGAGLGGLAGGAADWLDEENDNPDSLWDGITSGAMVGGAAGYGFSPYISSFTNPALPDKELVRRQQDPTARKSVTPSTPDSEQKSLADVLPAGYREKAQEHAKAYREEQGSDLFEPDVDWTQDLSDEAIDRKVRMEYFKGDPGDSNIDAMYYPPQKNNNGRDFMQLKETSDATTLGHELTHGTQSFDPSMFRRGGRKPEQSHSVLIDGLIESDPHVPNNRDYGRYLSEPHEEEAYLSTIKRDYFADTGKHVTNQREAEKALNWMRAKTPAKGELTPLFEGLLRGNGIPDTDMRESQRFYWIQELIKRMPGLVSNNQSNHGKTAYDTSISGEDTMLQIQNLAKQAASNSEDLVNMDTWGGLAADTIAPSTWGGERAGRTQAMSRAMDEPTTFGVKHPTTQAIGYGGAGGILGALAGAGIGGIYSRSPSDAKMGAGIGGGLGLLAGSGLAGLMRRKEMSRVNSLYDEDNAAGKLNPKEPKMSWLSALGLPMRGPHRTGQQEATKAMTSGEPLKGPSTIRNLLYGLGKVSGPGSALSTVHGYAQNAKTQLRSSERNGKKPKPKAERKNKDRDRDKDDDKEKAASINHINMAGDDNVLQIQNLAKMAALQMGGQQLADLRQLLQQHSQSAQSARGALGGALGGLAGSGAGALAGAGGAAGATIGGLKGLFSDPGEDEEGNQKSRLMAALKGGLGGGALGAAGGLAAGAGGLAGALGGGMAGQLGGKAIGQAIGPKTASHIPRLARATARR